MTPATPQFLRYITSRFGPAGLSQAVTAHTIYERSDAHDATAGQAACHVTSAPCPSFPPESLSFGALTAVQKITERESKPELIRDALILVMKMVRNLHSGFHEIIPVEENPIQEHARGSRQTWQKAVFCLG